MAKAKESIQLPDDLAAASLIDAKTCAAIGSMGMSWWFAAVRDGRAPAPAFRAVRATRWRRSEVLAFWQSLGQS